jgi:S-adenosylmethionine-diacylgycerolhomoserine-N-methlytransferase
MTMSFWRTWKLLIQFATRPIRGRTHAERLDCFYNYQADHYDAFRESFLRGRDDLVSRLPWQPGIRWCDLGCGTARLLSMAGERARDCQDIVLVDLCHTLLVKARERIASEGWTNCRIEPGDITSHSIGEKADIVTFSYSLSMTPDWFLAIDRAAQMLRPGGTLGVVDFYVARKYPIGTGLPSQALWTRHFWPVWFDTDDVHPCPDHVPYISKYFEAEYFSTARSRVPGMPWLRPPCYVYVGKRRVP